MSNFIRMGFLVGMHNKDHELESPKKIINKIGCIEDLKIESRKVQS